MRAVLEPGSKRAVAVEKRLAQMPVSSRGAYRRAVSGRSIAAGIKAACGECVGWQRAEVTACTALACPLWAYRPYQQAEAAAGISQEALGGPFQALGRDGGASGGDDAVLGPAGCVSLAASS